MPHNHVPRADRPSRKLALRALERYLDAHRDIRIGQAVVNACGGDDPFYVEDDALALGLDDKPSPATLPCGCTTHQFGCLSRGNEPDGFVR